MSHLRIHHQAHTRHALLALAAGTLFCLSPLAQAQPAPQAPGPVSFAAMDTDRDGRITAQEFAVHRAQRMAARAAEGRAMRNAGKAPTFAALDLDGNGSLSPDEVAAGQQQRFAARGYGRGGPGCWR